MTPHFELASAIFLAAIALLIAGMFHMIPQWTRPDIYFAVTVPAAFRGTPEARSILRNFRTRMWISTLVSFAVIFFGLRPGRVYLVGVGEFLLLGGFTTAFLLARRCVLPHFVTPSAVRAASLAPRPAHLPGGWIAQAGPFAILFAMALWLRAHWDRIPARFPVHWDLYGNPNGWADRTPRGVYGPLVIPAVVLAMLALLSYGILTRARRVVADVDLASGHVKFDFMHRMIVGILVLEYAMAFLFAYFGAMPVLGQPGLAMMFGAVIIFLASVFVLVGWLSRNRPPVPAPLHTAAESYAEVHHMNSTTPPSKAVGDGTPDAYWKLGIFYFNPNDAAVFVEKRFGIGYTMNFARPASWVILGAVLVVPIVVILLVAHK